VIIINKPGAGRWWLQAWSGWLIIGLAGINKIDQKYRFRVGVCVYVSVRPCVITWKGTGTENHEWDFWTIHQGAAVAVPIDRSCPDS